MRRRRQARDGSRAPAKGVAAIGIGAGEVGAADEVRAAATAAVIPAEDAEADGKSSCWLRVAVLVNGSERSGLSRC